jgi:hypothetical protein
MKNIFLLILSIWATLAHTFPLGFKGQDQSVPFYPVNVQSPYSQTTFLPGGDVLIDTGNKNMLINSGFEHSTVGFGWTQTGTATVTNDIGDPLVGKRSLEVSVASTTYSIYQDYTFNALTLAGQKGIASIWIYGSSTQIQLCARTDGVETNCTRVGSSASAGWTQYSVPVIFGSTSTGISVDVSSVTTVFKLDQAFLGLGEDPKELINYIPETSAEKTTFPWRQYTDAPAGVAPVSGSGGSALFLPRTTTNPLRGDYSFSFTKSSGNERGRGTSVEFSIDNADKAQVLKISFDYEVSSNYLDGDMRVYIYDITNAQVIEPLNTEIKAAGGTAKHVAAFQTNFDSVNYRLIFHVATVNSSTYNFKFDNVYVGPSIASAGVPDKEVVLNLDGSFTDGIVRVSRTGNQVTIRGGGSHASANSAVTSSNFLPEWARPTGGSIGNVYTHNTTWVSRVVVNGSGEISTVYRDWTGSLTSRTTSEGFAISYIAAPSNDISPSREVIGEVRTALIPANGSGGFTGGTVRVSKIGNQVTINTDTDLTHALSSSVSSASGFIPVWARPTSSKDNVFAMAGSVVQRVRIQSNGTLSVDSRDWAGAGINTISAAGLVISYTTSEDSNGIQGFAFDTTVAASYTDTSGQAVVSNTQILWNNKVYDTHNMYDSATGRFTIPMSGTYLLTVSTTTDSVAATVGNDYRVDLQNFTTAQLRRCGNRDFAYAATARAYSSSCTFIYKINKGDQIRAIWAESLPAVNLSTNAEQNTIAIQRIGN